MFPKPFVMATLTFFEMKEDVFSKNIFLAYLLGNQHLFEYYKPHSLLKIVKMWEKWMFRKTFAMESAKPFSK